MKKKCIYLLTVLVFAIMCTGCGKKTEQQLLNTIQTESGNQDTVTESDNQGAVTKIENETISATTFLDADYNYESNTFSIKNLVMNDVTGKYQFEQAQFCMGITPFDNGFVMLCGISKEKIKSETSGGIQISSAPDNYDSFVAYVFDSSANLQKTCVMDESIPDDDLLAPSITCSKDGTTLVIGSTWNIWKYDISTGSTEQLIPSENNDISFDNLVFTPSDDKLIFYGSDPRHEEGTLTYGMIDLKTKKMTSFTEADYTGGNIRCMGTYAVISDSLRPDGSFSGTSSGSVLILDLNKETNQVFSVDGTESANAVINSDGKYLFTVKETGNKTYLLRCYDTASSKITQEKAVSSVGESKIKQLIVNGTEAYLVLYTEKGAVITGQISAKKE